MNGGADRKVRKKLLDLDIVEAVLLIPTESKRFKGMPEYILILNKNKPDLCTHIAVCGYFEQEGSDDVNVSFRMVYQDPEASLEMEAVNAVHKTFAETVIEHIPCRFP